MKGEVCQIKVTLLNTDPLVWRRLLISANMPLRQLHRALQAAMGWEHRHLHSFRAGVGVSSNQLQSDARVGEVLPTVGSSLRYLYDPGDGWEHSVVLEERFRGSYEEQPPVCLDGERACPPEDCGGGAGYGDLLQALQKPNSRRYAELREWIGEDFDPMAFSVDAVNRELTAVLDRSRNTL